MTDGGSGNGGGGGGGALGLTDTFGLLDMATTPTGSQIVQTGWKWSLFVIFDGATGESDTTELQVPTFQQLPVYGNIGALGLLAQIGPPAPTGSPSANGAGQASGGQGQSNGPQQPQQQAQLAQQQKMYDDCIRSAYFGAAARQGLVAGIGGLGTAQVVGGVAVLRAAALTPNPVVEIVLGAVSVYSLYRGIQNLNRANDLAQASATIFQASVTNCDNAFLQASHHR